MRYLHERLSKHGPALLLLGIIAGVALISWYVVYRLIAEPIMALMFSALVCVTFASVVAPKSGPSSGGRSNA